MPLPFQIVANQGACPNSLLFHCFQFGLTFESFKELGARHSNVLDLVSLLKTILSVFDLE